MVVENGSSFALKSLARAKIRDQLKSILGPTHPKVDQDLGYLPKPVWDGTRDYIEKVCSPLNGCFQFGYYDAASVMVRRLVDTLIIEAYEKLKRESEIQGADGNYIMLGALVNAATGNSGISLGREGKLLWSM